MPAAFYFSLVTEEENPFVAPICCVAVGVLYARITMAIKSANKLFYAM